MRWGVLLTNTQTVRFDQGVSYEFDDDVVNFYDERGNVVATFERQCVIAVFPGSGVVTGSEAAGDEDETDEE